MATTSRILLTLVALGAAWAPPTTAQNDTVPSLMNGLEGGTATSIPFGTNQPARVQYIYDLDTLPWRGPRMIQRVSLRADNTTPNTTSFPSKGFLFVSLLLSTTSTTAETASAVFADNYGIDATVVVDNVPLQLPAQPPLPGVRPATIDFVLSTPWFYGLTPVRDGLPPPSNLLVEVRVHSQPDGVYRLDNIGSCQIPPVAFGSIGSQCAPAGGAPLVLEPGNSLVAGGTFTWTIRGAEPRVPMQIYVGSGTTGNLFGVPTLAVPLPLFDPANPSLPSPPIAALLPGFNLSAPGCWYLVAPFLILGGIADASGTGSISIGIPADRSFVGFSIFAQALAYSQTANALQITTSLGQQSTVCGPLGVARLYVIGSATAASGQLGLGQGAVIELH